MLKNEIIEKTMGVWIGYGNISTKKSLVIEEIVLIFRTSQNKALNNLSINLSMGLSF